MGSSRLTLPSCTSCITSRLQNCLLTEARRNFVSVVLGMPHSRFASPKASTTRDDDPDALTAREMEVLEWMVQGVTSNRALARQLGVSENTVKFHVRNILDKFHLHNRAQVVSYALRHGIVEAKPDEVV